MKGEKSEEQRLKQKAARLTNMTPADVQRWRKTKAYKDYRRYRDSQQYRGYTDGVVDRTIRVLRGKARISSYKKLISFIERHRKQSAGRKRFGNGNEKVSAHTAGLRNWGYDPTGRFSSGKA